VVVAGEGGEQACDEGWVSLEDRSNARSQWGSPESDGTLRVRGLLPGEFTVEVTCQGLVSAETYPRVLLVDRSVAGLRWEVTRGQAIRGVVVDANGKPVPRVNVSASPKPDPSQPRAHQTGTWGGNTDEKGGFELAGLMPGEYLISVNVWEPPRATPAKPFPASLVKGKDLEGLRLELPATGEVRGSVRDTQGKPIPRANIAMYDGVHWQHTAASDDGSFRFPFVAAGEYRLTARRGWGDEMRAPGTNDDDLQGEKVTVREGEVEEVKLVVEGRDGRITGVVRDADGGPLVDAFIERTRESDSATQASGQAMRSGRWGSFWQTPELTDPDGRFVLEDLEEGKHTLRAHRKGGGEAILEHVELGSDVVLTIAEAGRMSGTVMLVGGEAPEEFTVTARDDLTGFSRNDHFFRTGGAWSLGELPAGKYKIHVNAGPGSAEVEVSMTAGQDTSGVRVELAPKVLVRGRVVDLAGLPVPGLRVSVSAEGGGYSFGGGDDEKLNITDAAGRYEVEHAPTGKVQVMVMPRNWDDEDYGWISMPSFIAATGDAVELPPIKVSKKRVKQDQAAGDFGYGLKESEPGADPLQQRMIVAVIRPGSAAAAAGLKLGDEIVSVDGQDVTGGNSYLIGALTEVLEGTVVNFGLAGGATLAIPAGKRP
jgi:protocatechuate 3,4-dioxygenase beta subunit